MAVHPESDHTDEPDRVGLNRQERRLAGKRAKPGAKPIVKIATRGQYGIAANHRQYSHRRHG